MVIRWKVERGREGGREGGGREEEGGGGREGGREEEGGGREGGRRRGEGGREGGGGGRDKSALCCEVFASLFSSAQLSYSLPSTTASKRQSMRTSS